MTAPRRLSDREEVRAQYATDANLSARQALHQRFSVNRQGWSRWLFEELEMPPGARVLEVGCGNGALWRDNSERLSADRRLTLSDLSAGMLRDARRLLGAAPAHGRWVVADAQALPFASGSFDVVIANHMLYHVPDRRVAIGELRRVLAPRGQLYAATNGRGHMRELNRLLARAGYDAALNAGSPFTLENGAAQLRAAFPVVESRRYVDAIEATEAGPVIDYVQSMGLRDRPTGERNARIREAVEAAIRERGAFRITKAAGVFRARAE